MKTQTWTNSLILACAILLAGNLAATMSVKSTALTPTQTTPGAAKHNIVYSSSLTGLRDQLDKWSADGWRTTGLSYNGSQYIAVLEK